MSLKEQFKAKFPYMSEHQIDACVTAEIQYQERMSKKDGVEELLLEEVIADIPSDIVDENDIDYAIEIGKGEFNTLINDAVYTAWLLQVNELSVKFCVTRLSRM